jgi:hypothetical protein
MSDSLYMIDTYASFVKDSINNKFMNSFLSLVKDAIEKDYTFTF